MRRGGLIVLSAFIICLVLLLGPAACAQGTQGEFITEYQLDRDVVEFPFEYVDHQILIKGGVKGDGSEKQDLTFLFDSGASAPVLDTLLGLHGRHMDDTNIQEAEGSAQSEAVWMNEIDLGPEGSAARATNIGVLLMDLSRISTLLHRRIDAILGITFMAGFVVEIDYAKHLLRFHRATDYALSPVKPDNQRTFMFDIMPTNLFRRASSVLITGRLHPKYDYDFLLDTGFGGYVSVSHTAAEQAGMVQPDTPRVTGSSYSVSHSFRTEKIRAPFLTLGEINLSNKIVTIDYRNNDAIGQPGIVGNLFLQNYHVTLDYPRRKLLLERVTTTEEPDEAGKPAFGLVIRMDGKKVFIDHVKRYSPAQHAGVRTGDQLISVAGKMVSDLSQTEIVEMLTSAQKETSFRLQHGTDPNLGTGGDDYVVSIVPLSPLDWTEE